MAAFIKDVLNLGGEWFVQKELGTKNIKILMTSFMNDALKTILKIVMIYQCCLYGKSRLSVVQK